MMKSANRYEPTVSILYKNRGSSIYVEAVFNNPAVALFDAKYPNRTSIHVFVDVDTHALGFEIISELGTRTIHHKSVSVTKAERQLNLQETYLGLLPNIKQVPIVWDKHEEMYIAIFK